MKADNDYLRALMLTWAKGSKGPKRHRGHPTVADIHKSELDSFMARMNYKCRAGVNDPRLWQLLDLAQSADSDVAELAAADIFREFGELDNAE
jgi:hypothetical protein